MMNISTNYDADLLEKEPDFEPYFGICPKPARKKSPIETEYYIESLI